MTAKLKWNKVIGGVPEQNIFLVVSVNLITKNGPMIHALMNINYICIIIICHFRLVNDSNIENIYQIAIVCSHTSTIK